MSPPPQPQTQHQQHLQRPITILPSVGSTLGNPSAFAIGAFATTLTTLSTALMEWRGVTTTNAFIANFLFLAGVGMVVSAQWEMVRGNTYAYTVLSAFGLFYAGYGAVITPSFGVADAYGGDGTVEYSNAMGLYMIIWTVLNAFFLIGSLGINTVYILIFLALELCFLLLGASHFAAADGHARAATALQKAAGAFGFLSGLCGYYTLGSLLFAEVLAWEWPMGGFGVVRCAGRRGVGRKRRKEV
ncbi:GPR1/FUN34/yaaH family-domain-containing protein [Phyllosticta citribraziliensis]|uniref:GPR1/FUN34/yaaH family-domain-containing protein n=1 Tax=Phyllosticta citribraziliensis TaxID=989973 RepID=A0ABR1LR30_9PEZI